MPGSRVVTVSSIGHRIRAAIHFDDLQWERSYSRVAAYGQSKLANLMFTYELQRRLATHGTTVAVAAHPGMSNTDSPATPPRPSGVPLTWLAPLITQTPAMGALPTLRAATDPAVARRPVLSQLTHGHRPGQGGILGETPGLSLVRSSCRLSVIHSRKPTSTPED